LDFEPHCSNILQKKGKGALIASVKMIRVDLTHRLGLM
jgi:hypothetical protein